MTDNIVQIIKVEQSPSGESIKMECQSHEKKWWGENITAPAWLNSSTIAGKWKKNLRVWQIPDHQAKHEELKSETMNSETHHKGQSEREPISPMTKTETP